jgi:ABC-2 type transport system permease protein
MGKSNIINIKTLVLMQLKDKVDLDFLKTKKTLISTIVFSAIKFISAVLFSYILFFVALYLKVFNLSNYIPGSVVTVVFTFMLFLSVIFCTFSLMNKLYFSKDNFILLSLPVSTSSIFLSKLIVFFVYEIKKNINFLIPLFFAFGLISNFTLLYFLWVIFAFVLISALTVAISAMLSIPTMFLYNFFKRKIYLQAAVITGVIAIIFAGIMRLISLMPANINIIGAWGSVFWGIQDFLAKFIEIFAPIHSITTMIIGERITGFVNVFFTAQNLLTLFNLIVALIVIMSICMLFVKPFFFKMASQPFEYKKNKSNKEKKNIKTPALLASIKKESILIIRSPKSILRAALVFCILPIALFFSNNIYAAMNTRLLGQYMTFSFNLLIVLLIITSHNVKIASIYSREGTASNLMKTAPGNQLMFLFSKIFVETLLVLFSLIGTLVILQLVNPMPLENVIMFFITAAFVYLAHLLMSAELDVMNSQTQHYVNTEETENNPNENKSAISSFVFSALFFIMSLFLFMESVFLGWLKIASIAVVFFLFRLYLFINKAKIYIKER